MNRFFQLFLISGVVIFSLSCSKDSRGKYIGKWNFKETVFYYSGYYDYNVPPGNSPNWVSTQSTTVNYNDNSGSIRRGFKPNELIIKYCETCEERKIDLRENGKHSWNLTVSNFIDYVQPPPGGYSSSYTTVTVEGIRL
ncbi:MAG: hypothetical protein EP305_13420 [Bacteroidetes bacterium]|nr:MAG: hypothetical protein EP305_13420 [Bacteroidota bacterium]